MLYPYLLQSSLCHLIMCDGGSSSSNTGGHALLGAEIKDLICPHIEPVTVPCPCVSLGPYCLVLPRYHIGVSIEIVILTGAIGQSSATCSCSSTPSLICNI